MSDPVENLEDVLMLGVIVAVIVGLGFGAEQVYAFFHKDGAAAKPPVGPKNNDTSARSLLDPTSTASNLFFWKPSTASTSNSFWQWISYLFNVPEGSEKISEPSQSEAQYNDAAQNPIATLDAPTDGSWGIGGDLWNTGKL